MGDSNWLATSSKVTVTSPQEEGMGGGTPLEGQMTEVKEVSKVG